MATKGLMPGVGVEGSKPFQHIFPTVHPCARQLNNFRHSHPLWELFLHRLRVSLGMQLSGSHSWREWRSFIQQECPGDLLCAGPSFYLSKNRTLQNQVSVPLCTAQQMATREWHAVNTGLLASLTSHPILLPHLLALSSLESNLDWNNKKSCYPTPRPSFSNKDLIIRQSHQLYI